MKPESLARCSSLANQRTNVAYGLNRADLVIREHQRDQSCVRPERVTQIVELHDAVCINRQTRNFPSALFQFQTNACDRRMLDCRSDDVPAVRSLAQSTDCEVVCLCAAGSEDNLVLLCADQCGHFAPRAIDCRPRLLSKTVHARCVAEVLDQRTTH